MRRVLFLVITLVVLLTLLAANSYTNSAEINWYAFGPGSNKLSSDLVELHGMLGQGIAGEVSQAESELCSGYMCIFKALAGWIYLPLIMK